MRLDDVQQFDKNDVRVELLPLRNLDLPAAVPPYTLQRAIAITFPVLTGGYEPDQSFHLYRV